ncbi:gliding motility protein GldN [Pedobacter sp. SL55]|uniref:type IX secretion system ring protein PorN/GldN n=1 Tax=Pedobacter sp. SL55 TaxID=2995161 RepID=UPI00227046AF|nr:gliding motility protein GldN [Pedobacter sp. SL55]WAC41279.1 gliding motility protein GldN [Pedobacter sp. SL55]
MKKGTLLFVVAILFAAVSFAQKGNARQTNAKQNNAGKTTTPVSTPVVQKADSTKKVVAKKTPKVKPKDGYAMERELRDTASEKAFLPVIKDEDVVYTKRVWRDIDLRDTINGVLNYPKSRLIEVLITHVKNEELTAYNPKNPTTLDDVDGFDFPLDTADALRLANGVVNVTNNKTGTVTQVPGEFNPELFKKYRIKEDWVFDGKRGVFEPRIVALAPLKLNDQTKEWQPVFWIAYEEARDILATKRLFNSLNDSSPLSMDDFFIHRLFSSHIVKETNAGDYKVKDLIGDPRQRLLESERIKKKMADMEQALWEY